MTLAKPLGGTGFWQLTGAVSNLTLTAASSRTGDAIIGDGSLASYAIFPSLSLSADNQLGSTASGGGGITLRSAFLRPQASSVTARTLTVEGNVLSAAAVVAGSLLTLAARRRRGA